MPCNFTIYDWRQLAENFFCNFKEFCRFAARHDKIDASFAAVGHLVGSYLALE